MFDSFDTQVNCEERTYQNEIEAFEEWYGEDFKDYCDELNKRAKSSYYMQNFFEFDEI